MGGSKDQTQRQTPAELIDAGIKELGDWRGEMLARIKELIKQVDPDVVRRVDMARGLKALVRAAVQLNTSQGR